MKVKEIMTKEVISVKRSTKLRELLEMFKNFHIFPLVPVLEENTLSEQKPELQKRKEE